MCISLSTFPNHFSSIFSNLLPGAKEESTQSTIEIAMIILPASNKNTFTFSTIVYITVFQSGILYDGISII